MRKFLSITCIILVSAALLCGCQTANANTAPEFQSTDDVQTINLDMDAAALVADIPTTQYFTDEAVAAGDIDTILLAGSNAPSAMNGQPWHFSAITDPAVIEEISGGMSFGGPPAGMMEMLEGAEPPEGMGQMPEDFEPPQDRTAPGGKPPAGGEKPGNAPGGDMPAPPAGGTKAGVEDAPLVIVVSCKAGSEFDAGLACQNMSVEAQLLGYGTKIVSAPTMAINAEGKEALRETLGIPEGYTACALLLVGKADTAVDTAADTYTGATERNAISEVVTYLNP